MVLWGPEGKREKEGITKGHWEGEVAGDGYVHCLDFVDGFMVEYIYKMHKILHFKYVHFIICQLYLTTRLSTKNSITAIFLTWQLSFSLPFIKNVEGITLGSMLGAGNWNKSNLD